MRTFLQSLLIVGVVFTAGYLFGNPNVSPNPSDVVAAYNWVVEYASNAIT